ncbi:MAG: ATP-binding protein [Candidatus Kapabacteria bacterium]|nr:ATP-binding protein [Candidatus Kapabacteria bacterium]
MKQSHFFLLVILFFGFNISLKADQYTDSLINVLSQTKDEYKRADMMNFLSKEFSTENTSKGIQYGQEAYKLSSKLNYTNGMIFAKRHLAENYFVYNLTDSMAENYNAAIDLCAKSNNNELIAKIYCDFGFHLIYLSFNEKAVDFLLKSLSIFQEIGNDSGVVAVNKFLGSIYIHKNSQLSLEYYLKAISLAEEKNVTGEFVILYNNMGLCYSKIGDKVKSIENYNKAIDFAKKTDINSLIYTYHIQSFSYLDDKDWDNALDVLRKAISLKSNHPDLIVLGDIYSKLAHIYMVKKNYQLELENNLIALNFRKQVGISRLIASSLTNVGSSFINLQKYDSAKYYLKLANHELLKNDKVNRLMCENLKVLYTLYKKINKLDSALIYFELYSQYNIQAVNDENLTQSMNKQFGYDRELKQNELHASKIQNIYLALIIFLFVLLCIALYLRFISVRKVNLLLNQQKNVLEQTNNSLEQTQQQLSKSNQELELRFNDIQNLLIEVSNAKKIVEQSAAELSELNKTKDKFFSIIAHDLTNPIASFRVSISVMLKYFDQMTTPEKINYLESAKKNSELLSNLLENLLIWSRSQRRIIGFDPININLKKSLDSNINVLATAAKNKEISIINLVDNSYSINSDEFMTDSILRNIISNAIKFSFRANKVIISARKINDDFIEISIKDFGIGLLPENIDLLFQVDSKVSTPGTENEPSTGLGLIICKEFLDRHTCNIKIESEIGKGSTFIFTLPAAK